MEQKHYYNLDRLKICYRMSSTMVNYLNDEDVDLLETENFTLFRKVRGKGQLVIEIHIPYEVTKTKEVVFGELVVDLNDYEHLNGRMYARLAVDNEFLYNTNPNINLSSLLRQFTSDFDCEFNNLSQVEIACDVEYNASAAIFKALRAHKDPILIMGKTVKDVCQKQTAIIYEFQGSLVEFTDMCIRFKTRDSKSEFYVYDKNDEIKRSKKAYIKKHHKTTSETLFRLECRFSKEQAEQLAKRHKKGQEDYLYDVLLSADGLKEAWRVSSMRYIRIKKDRRHIYDILTYVESNVITDGGSFCHIPF